MAALDTT